MLRGGASQCERLASPAGFEPATCGLEIRCCYPAELRGHRLRVLVPSSLSFAAAQIGAWPSTTGGRRSRPKSSRMTMFGVSTGALHHSIKSVHKTAKTIDETINLDFGFIGATSSAALRARLTEGMPVGDSAAGLVADSRTMDAFPSVRCIAPRCARSPNRKMGGSCKSPALDELCAIRAVARWKLFASHQFRVNVYC